MKIGELFSELSGEKILKLPACPSKSGDNSADIREIAYDSRKIPAGGGVMFACFRGVSNDGHDFAKEALRNGASTLLCEREIPGLPADVPMIVVSDVRTSMGEAASVLYGHPARKMTMIAVTGTNGKTTTAYIIRSVMRSAGFKTGMIGTIAYDDALCETEASRTTPEGPDVQRLLASMVQNGASCCVMEASSHGLHQGRLEGCVFDRAGFSNLTIEHLEYHGDMENYFAAKRLLFARYMRGDWRASVNADDAYGRRLMSEFPGRTRGFSLESGDGGLYRCCVTEADIDGTTLVIIFPDGARVETRSPFIGAHNVSNVLESVAIADSLDVPREKIARGVSSCAQVPGRLERYDLGSVSAFVDFAHSPDGLEKALSTLSALKRGKLWILWGAGGDRAPQKRPIAGEVMARMADRIVITTDNPRTERPEDIARQVEAGVISSGVPREYDIILDRREAVRRTLDAARPGDVVLIAGKGPENYMDFGDHKVHFSDSETILEWAHGRSGNLC
ncbi:MAG: UDP-N-acetylmuramoyl-L-alanyl-D-glutamate--2,6-diaminopimelate ligase [Synergistaceae bacterium]|nr:UDP-N-acetylmuramoyl-L-alanyl-D-glutamate--2,6-diaminopimelate ligase [Synergistaceae bacterium]